MNCYPQIKLDPDTDLDEIEAVWQGDIIGDYYTSDDETWACLQSLEAWQLARALQEGVMP